MNKLDLILRELLRNGKLSYGESVAIYGACHTLAEHSELWPAFAESYGTIAREGLDSLMAESEGR